MLPFDPGSYVQKVLAPVVGGAPLPDMFARYLLEPDDEDDAAIRERMAEVKAHWDKLQARNNIKYDELLKRLIHEHSAAGLTLFDPVERRGAAERARAERAEADARRRHDEQEFEQQLTEVLARAKGLTTRDRLILEEFSRGLDLDAAAVAARLDGCPTIADHRGADPLSDDIRERIGRGLASYAAASGNPSRGISLFHALELSGPEYDAAILESSWERCAKQQRELTVEHPAKTAMATVLSLARVHLIEDDPAVYTATLVLDVRDALRPRAARAAIDDGGIDELESEQLVREAQERGLPAQEARYLVAELARDLGVELRLGAAVDYVACANCNRPHPVTGAPERCTKCGQALFRSCPKCQARGPASDAACSACGTDLAAYARSLKAMSDARLAIEAGLLAAAAALLAEAGEGAGDEDRQALSAELERGLRQARSEWEVIEREIGERRLYTAVVHLAQLEQRAVDVAGPAGVPAAERRAAVVARIGEVERLLSRARGASREAREQSLASALEQAVDCREAEQELGQMPPLAPGDVRAVVDLDGIRVSWSRSPSPGPIRYRVARSLAQASAATEVEITAALSAADPEAPAGEILTYGVTSERAAGASTTVWSTPVLLAREVERLSVTERSGEVHLAWAPVGANARIEVERTDEESGGTVALRPDRAGLVDRTVRNGSRYRYRVRIAYPGTGGRLVHTDGKVVFGAPAQRPEPVRDLSAEMDGSRVRLRCATPAAGTVSVLRCTAEPSVEEGEELSPKELAAIGEPLALDVGGIYDPDPANFAWYLPVSQSGAYLVAGRAIRHLALPRITDVRAVDLGASVRVTWSWPERVRAAVVLSRRDRQPVDADDERALRLAITQAQYTEQGGVELQAVGTEPVFLAVFPAMRMGEELVCPGGTDRRARLAVRRSAKVDIRYAVRRSGLRKRQVCFEVLEPAEPLPELVLVAKRGELLPRTADDGSVIARLGGHAGPREQGFDLGELGRPVAVRLFFGSIATGVTHRLREPDTQELIFR